MSSRERFEKVQEIFHAVRKLAPAERRDFLMTRVQDDSIRQEIESLLAADMPSSNCAASDGTGAAPLSGVSLGTQVGPYQVISVIGTGGMGQVYRAHDSNLHRDIALKVLLPAFAMDTERRSRFVREAQVLAALNHPNIAVIYGLEESANLLAIAMEMVAGETLGERMSAGPIPVHDAVRIARQIAEALDAAHERGIIHRDLKPSNVKVTPEGLVKVLDFGLAKDVNAGNASDRAASLDAPPTTREGVILGTAAYMSPEQARGVPVDKRTDIWALGVVLFEMLSGRRAFIGDTMADVLAAVVKDELDLSGLPPHIGAVVARCLSKEPGRRWGSMGDVLWAFDNALPHISDSRAAVAPVRRLYWAAAFISVVAGIATWFWKPKSDDPLLEFEITAPQGTKLGPAGLGQLAISPNGRRLAFIATSADGNKRLWVRSLDSAAVVAVAGTENTALYPFWSADSRWLGFSANGRLQKIDVTGGGPPQVICECATVYASWNSAGTIVFGTRDQPIQRVSASGGGPVRVFDFDASQNEIRQGGPDFLPDGKRFLYGSFGKDVTCMLGSLDGKTRRYLFSNSESPAFYAANPAGGGALLYIANGQLFARPFDLNRTEFTGEPDLIADSMGDGPAWSTSSNGLLAFRHKRQKRSQLTWFDRQGNPLSTLVEPGFVAHPRISPDQRTVAFVRTEGTNSDIWLRDSKSDASIRFTSDPGADDYPVWPRDDNRLIYSSTRDKDYVLVDRPVYRIGREMILLRKPAVGSRFYGSQLLSKLPTGTTLDGRWIIATETFGARSTVWLVPRDENLKPIPLMEGSDGTVSPDGRWLLYASAGSHPDVFIRSLPAEAGGPVGAGAKWQISTAGGGNPVWRGDGKEIFYLATDGKLMSAAIESGKSYFRPSTPKPLFQTRLMPTLIREYDVMGDGKRFLLNVPALDNADEPITVIVNWPKLLKQSSKGNGSQ
jgi:serine/threonine protein kinase